MPLLFPSPDLFPSEDLYPIGLRRGAHPETPHMRWPFQRSEDTGKVEIVEQGTIDHIQSQEWAVTVCPVGFRHERPDFGWDIPSFRIGKPNPQALVEALDRLVPGPARRTAEAYRDLADPSKWYIQVTDEVASNG